MGDRERNVVKFERAGRRWSGDISPARRDRRPRFESFRRNRKLWIQFCLVLTGGITVIALSEFGFIAGARFRGTNACTIVRVTDGDTLRLYCPGKGVIQARLLGFDTPEKKDFKCLSERWAAEKATWALRRFIWSADKKTYVFGGADRYGRTLVTLFLDGENVARKMIAADHARAYRGGLRQGWCA